MTASSNRALLERFYAAFSARDGSGMGACYGAAAHFRDPVFELEGARILKPETVRLMTSVQTPQEISGRRGLQSCESEL